ncbi:membrane metallo-endopeptidase-like 1 [Ixodes scapularis]|uniref:membrane metallo-endopeptidase-like 1 n=1 Tax=Ixodes scapularis TaxID=6945 RepID=UPI001A9F38C3|nr:membrane metallo-endopeptidase-like 1 [Ixodes scapularis]
MIAGESLKAEAQLKKRKEEKEIEETQRAGSIKKIAASGCFLVFIGVVVFFAVHASKIRGNPQAQTKKMCTTIDCVQHKFLLQEGMDASVDPCENFTAHVCGNTKWADVMVSSTEQYMMTKWLKNGALYMSSGIFNFPVTKKAEALFASCKNTRKSEIEDMRIFMRERGLPWPNKAVTSRHPLDVVLDLYINWGVVFWFEISLPTLLPGTRSSISFSRSGKAKFARERMLDVKSKMSDIVYAKRFYDISNTKVLNESDLVTLLKNEDAILNILVSNIPPKRKIILMHQIEKLTPNILRDEHWITYLNLHLGSYKLGAEDKALLEDQQLLIDINMLFHKFSHAELLDHLGWWFVQEYLILASSEASSALHAYENSRESYIAYDCYAEVENHYRNLLFMERKLAKERGGKDTRIPQEIIEHTVSLLERNKTWAFGEGSREAVKKVVREISQLPQIPDSDSGESNRHYFETMYNSYPSSERSFMRLWMATATAHKNASGWPLNDTLLRRPVTSSSIVEYDMWQNTLFVTQSVYNPPAFYENGLQSMNYGGLGTLIALQVVKALNRKDSQVEPSWNPIDNVGEGLGARPACRNVDHRVLLQIAAVQVAFSAYLAAGGEKSSRLKYLENYPLDQVFFYSHCKTMCGQGDYCSDTLRHLGAFAKAFDCPDNSYMNPPQKCTYFD